MVFPRSRRFLVALAATAFLGTSCAGEAELAVPESASSISTSTPTVTSLDPAESSPTDTSIASTLPTTTQPSTTLPPTTPWTPLTAESRVLLIGDSISIGYAPFVAENFGDDGPVVVRNEGNAQSTNHALSGNRIYEWIGDGDWAVIYFNFGLHDLAWADAGQAEVAVGTEGAGPRVPLDRYEAQLQDIVNVLRETDAHLIFATTTPVYATEGSRYASAELAYNNVAISVMQRNGITISDLHGFALANIRVNQLVGGSDNVHFTPAGYEALADAVVAALENPPTS